MVAKTVKKINIAKSIINPRCVMPVKVPLKPSTP